MNQNRLISWLVKWLMLFSIGGGLLAALIHFRVYRRYELIAAQREFEATANLAAMIIKNRRENLATPDDYQQICLDLGMTTQKRVTLIAPTLEVLGDSLHGSRYRLDKPLQAPGFHVDKDPLAQQENFLFIKKITGLVLDDQLSLRISAPHIPDLIWRTQCQQGTILVITLWMGLSFLCALILNSKLKDEISVLFKLVQAMKPGGSSGHIKRLRVHEFAKLANEFDGIAAVLHDKSLQLEQYSHEWKTIFASMHEGVVVLNHQRQIRLINQAAKLFLIIDPRKTAVGKPLLEIIRHTSMNNFLDTIAAHNNYAESEIQIELQVGDIRCYHVSGVSLTFPNQSQPDFLLVFNDITRLKKLERVRQEFVANVSHELKTPITTLKGMLESLPECLDQDTDQAKKFITIMARNTERLNTIIDDLLYLSSLDQEDVRDQHHFQTIPLLSTVNHAAALHQDKLLEKHIALEVDGDNPPFYANHQLLEQALSNLIENAIKYSPTDSIISITTQANKNEIIIRVRDQGIGITPYHQSRIFERFYRVDKSRDRQSGGSGLGLSIAKRITEFHHGSIDIISEPNVGSTFILRLPRVIPPV